MAISADGQAFSVISTLDDVKDKEAGIAKIKEGIEDYLKDIEYDEPTETEQGSVILSGTGKGKKTDVDLVFSTAVFTSGKGQLSAIAFLIDADIEKYYEKTVLAICKSVLVESDFAEEEEGSEEAATSQSNYRPSETVEQSTARSNDCVNEGAVYGYSSYGNYYYLPRRHHGFRRLRTHRYRYYDNYSYGRGRGRYRVGYYY